MSDNNQDFLSQIPTVTRTILLVTVGVFLLQIVSASFLPFDITPIFALNMAGILHGQIWRFITYLFLHGNFLHIFVNMFVLVIFGAEMERNLGKSRFMLLYFVCGIIGGIGWLIISGNVPGYCIGASGAILGLVGAYAGMFPTRKITLLLFFVIPLTMAARTMAIGIGLFSLFALIGNSGNIAHAAHLFGGLAGYLYGRRMKNGLRER